MSLRLRITIPDGELLDHLEGRSSKGATVELIRLATNYLHMSRNVESPMYQRPNQLGMNNDKVVKIPTASSTDFSAEEVLSEAFESNETVNFGDDLLNM